MKICCKSLFTSVRSERIRCFLTSVERARATFALSFVHFQRSLPTLSLPMRSLPLSLLVLSSLLSAASLHANDEIASESSKSESAENTKESIAWASFSPEASLDIKRQIMSRPGVFLDMANLTDNGYVWANDVVWEGADLPANEKWHIAAFLFQRDGYKGVWLQYAFTLDDSTAKVNNFRRWFGAPGFR